MPQRHRSYQPFCTPQGTYPAYILAFLVASAIWDVTRRHLLVGSDEHQTSLQQVGYSSSKDLRQILFGAGAGDGAPLAILKAMLSQQKLHQADEVGSLAVGEEYFSDALLPGLDVSLPMSNRGTTLLDVCLWDGVRYQ